MNESTRWTWRDSAVVVVAFLLPLLSGTWAFAVYESWSLGNWSSLEIDWTFWSIVGLALTAVKSWLLYGDLKGVAQLGRDWRYRLGAAWTFSNSLGFCFAFLAFAVVGTIGGQFATPASGLGPQRIPIQYITGGIFLVAEAVLIGVVSFGLICRVRLAE